MKRETCNQSAMSILPLINQTPCCLNGLGCRIRRLGKLKIIVVCIFCSFLIACLLAVSPIPLAVEECRCNDQQSVIEVDRHSKSMPQTKFLDSHKLAILVPYRDRFEELLTFAPYMNSFLTKQNLNFQIFILNQVDRYRFNRASLINVGFRVARNECDYIAMHDVDLLPINPHLSYKYPEAGPFHVASPELHPRYHYPTFVGGILLVKREDFETVNGMSNQYWGWGLEDDEFYVRLKQAKLNVSRPVNITTGTENTFRHNHDKAHRKRDMAKCFNQREVTRRHDRKTGLADVAFDISSVNELVIDGALIKIINIELKCDRFMTPWCDCGENSSGATSSKKNSLKRNKTM